MQRRRFAQIVAAAALGLGVPSFWHQRRRALVASADAPAALDPLFQRLVVAPGDDPAAISLSAEGAHLIEIDRTGALTVHTGSRVRRQPTPHAYQDIDGRRREVSVRFDLAPAGDPHLVVGPYDRSFPLVIEPWPGKDDLKP